MILFGGQFIDSGYQEVIIPSIWNSETFLEKLGKEKESQMWTFKDKADRPVCLVPEITGIIQENWRNRWINEWPKPSRIFYVSRCYRYERPQAGRYREFTQFGIELLGGKSPDDWNEAVNLLKTCLNKFPIKWKLVDSVKRGLSYYIEDGFEVEVESLGPRNK